MQKDMTQIHKRAINLPPFIQNVCFIAISWPISASDKYVTYLCVYSFVGLSVGLPLKSQLSAHNSREPHSELFLSFPENSLIEPQLPVPVAPAPLLLELWALEKGWMGHRI